jgi:predicted small lipoprotein YifL
MSTLRFRLSLLLLALSLAGLAGCGNKGDLVRPAPPPTVQG